MNRREFLIKTTGVAVATTGILSATGVATVPTANVVTHVGRPDFTEQLRKMFSLQGDRFEDGKLIRHIEPTLKALTMVRRAPVRVDFRSNTQWRHPWSVKMVDIVPWTDDPVVESHTKTDEFLATKSALVFMSTVHILAEKATKMPMETPSYISIAQAGNDIAKTTRRGVGRVVVMNRKGEEWLNSLSGAKLPEWIVPVRIDDKAVPPSNLSKEPLVLVGYRGEIEEDTGAILHTTITRRRGGGGFVRSSIVNVDIESYWRRLTP